MMKLVLWSALLLIVWTLPAAAQTGGAQTGVGGVPPASPAPLQMEPEERQFFALGMTLSRGAFAYAELANRASEIAKTRSKITQVGQLGKLDPLAGRSRTTAHVQIGRALVLMRLLHAPPGALHPITAAETRLDGPIPISSDARPLEFFSRPAARTLSALREFETLSSLPEDPAIQAWLASSGVSRSASVWYGEGEIVGLAQIAAAHQMPDLLPPAEQLATDLRGLRDWLSLRLPDTPTAEQITLKKALNAFLEGAADTERPGVKSRKLLTLPQLQALGSISSQLQAQVLGVSATETAERF